ncbi:hypothetical protein [Streptomyces cavernicola]|uniref:Secreted protein n=1 Tax=Streptomyces cavernicola TaxID=3043613 RepID=A0ABT6SM90_9ACTN|nr:hypothetical protein [Streptomyces sp. B-S-A6]MDI3409300.1 hypothetical protein [Streptomyces sp. B-S-A6]
MRSTLLRRTLIPATALALAAVLPAQASADTSTDLDPVPIPTAEQIAQEDALAALPVVTEGDARLVVAKAKVKVDVKIGAEIGVTTGHEYRRKIASGKYGHLQYGSWGYKTTWAKYETSADRCGKRLLRKGRATLPTSETGWRYWETNS